MKYIKSLSPIALTIAIIHLIFGVILVVWPDTSMLTICRVAACMLVLIGVGFCAAYFAQDRYLAAEGHRLTVGLIGLVIGVFILLRPEIVVDITPFLIGLLLVFDSADRIQNALDLYRLSIPRWKLSLIAGVITLTFGVTLMNRPFESAVLLTRFIGLSLIIDAAAMLMSGFLPDQNNISGDLP